MFRTGFRGAFTLIELLVVVAIIALLISILLPSLGRAREVAKRTACAANLKANGTSIIIFAELNERRVPYGQTGNGHYGSWWLTSMMAADFFWMMDNAGGNPKTWQCPAFPYTRDNVFAVDPGGKMTFTRNNGSNNEPEGNATTANTSRFFLAQSANNWAPNNAYDNAGPIVNFTYQYYGTSHWQNKSGPNGIYSGANLPWPGLPASNNNWPCGGINNQPAWSPFEICKIREPSPWGDQTYFSKSTLPGKLLVDEKVTLDPSDLANPPLVSDQTSAWFNNGQLTSLTSLNHPISYNANSALAYSNTVYSDGSAAGKIIRLEQAPAAFEYGGWSGSTWWYHWNR